VLGMQTGYLMLSMGDIAGAEVMFDRAAGRPQVFFRTQCADQYVSAQVPKGRGQYIKVPQGGTVETASWSSAACQCA
jgi:hypothetical protein